MRSFRLLAAGASAMALVLSACQTGGAPSPTPAPTTAPAKPPIAPSPAAAAPSPAASPKPAASPVASPAAAAASPSPAAAGPKPTIRIASFNFDESEVLQELYGAVLQTNGYTVERRTRLGTREIVAPALESGQIDLVPEYLATLERFHAKDNSKATGEAAVTHKALQDVLTPKNLTVLDFSQAVDQNGFVVTKATADKHKLAKMSDLVPLAKDLVLGATPECPNRPFCLPGLKSVYGLEFKEHKPLDSGGPLTVIAVETGQVDVGLLFTTDPNITLKGFILLEDDKHLQLADNVAPVIRNDILTRAPEVRQLLNSVSSKLTTAELTDLNKQVGIDHKDANDVAQAYLKAKGVIR